MQRALLSSTELLYEKPQRNSRPLHRPQHCCGINCRLLCTVSHHGVQLLVANSALRHRSATSVYDRVHGCSVLFVNTESSRKVSLVAQLMPTGAVFPPVSITVLVIHSNSPLDLTITFHTHPKHSKWSLGRLPDFWNTERSLVFKILFATRGLFTGRCKIRDIKRLGTQLPRRSAQQLDIP